MNRNYTISLAFNLPSETTKATERLYSQNDKSDFRHLIFDLGFPLEEGDVIPADIEKAKKNNTEKLKELAFKFGSKYVQMDNDGVSPNWTKAIKACKLHDSDTIIGVDPDEIVLNDGWVYAMGCVLRADDIALVSLLQVGVEDYIKPVMYEQQFEKGERYWMMKGLINWALIGMNGKFLKTIDGTIPFPANAPTYGFIEGELLPLIQKHDYYWCILPDILVEHTDNVPLYRQWKNYIILEHPNQPQITFEEWLIKKREGEI